VDANGPAGVGLVAHRVGKGLHRPRAEHGVAMVVDPCMEVHEGQWPFDSQDGATQMSQRSTAHLACFSVLGR
jgi:hypothetical protein